MPEHISDSGNTSGIVDLRRRKNASVQLERGVRVLGRNNSVDTKTSAGGRGGDTPSARVGILLQPRVKSMVRQAVHLQPMNVHGEAGINLKPMKDSRAGSCSKEALPP